MSFQLNWLGAGTGMYDSNDASKLSLFVHKSCVVVAGRIGRPMQEQHRPAPDHFIGSLLTLAWQKCHHVSLLFALAPMPVRTHAPPFSSVFVL